MCVARINTLRRPFVTIKCVHMAFFWSPRGFFSIFLLHREVGSCSWLFYSVLYIMRGGGGKEQRYSKHWYSTICCTTTTWRRTNQNFKHHTLDFYGIIYILHIFQRIPGATLLSGRRSNVNCHRTDEWNKTIQDALGRVIIHLSFLCVAEKVFLGMFWRRSLSQNIQVVKFIVCKTVLL